MPNTHQTLQDIADILSFESNETLLKARLESATMDWEHLVRVGSSHLVLPAIYCRLKAKQLLNTLPKELESYLKEITDLNRERNQQLLAEAQQISQWFQEAGIDHVFLKGTAMLASGYYEYLAERMVGDIDILVEESSLIKSFKFLENKNYIASKRLDEFYSLERHLPRLIPENKIGAVELHSKVINYSKFEKLKPSLILQELVTKNILNIPSNEILFRHAIMNFQFNDYSFYYNELSFKTTYDLLCIPIDFKNTFNKYEIAYIDIHNTYFKNIVSLKISHTLNRKIFNLKSKSKLFYKLYHYLVRFFLYTKFLIYRFSFYLQNKAYRTYINKHNFKLFKDIKGNI